MAKIERVINRVFERYSYTGGNLSLIHIYSYLFTYNPIILDGNWIFPFSQLTLGIYFHL